MGLLRQHHAAEGKVVLDLGCGFGATAEQIREFGLSYVGIDSDIRSVQDLTQRGFEAAEVDFSDTAQLRGVIESQLDGRPLAAITAVDLLGHITDGRGLLELLHSLSLSSGRPTLVVSVPNVTHIDVAAKLLIGRLDYMPTGLLDETSFVLYSPGHLRQVMTQTGWAEVGRNDFELSRSDQNFPADAAVLAADTPLNRLLLQIREQAAEGAIVSQFVRGYVPLEQAVWELPDPETTPFLSVLVRTQGKRMSTFVETLLSLAAQTVQDFEVLVLAHDVEPDTIAELHGVVEWFDPDFAQRVRVVRGRGWRKGPSVNVGVREARVRTSPHSMMTISPLPTGFRSSAKRRDPSRGARCGRSWPNSPLSQSPGEMQTVTHPPRKHGHPVPGSFRPLEAHVREHVAILRLRLSALVLLDMGVRFDETLAVVEDWDVILQVALLCGVTDSAAVLSLYRRWLSPHSSFAAHGADEWNRARDKVLARIDARVIPLPPGALSRFHRLYDEVENRRQWMDHLIFERNTARDERDEARGELKQRGARIADLEKLLNGTLLERNVAIEQAERTQAALDDMNQTVSWKLTKPSAAPQVPVRTIASGRVTPLTPRRQRRGRRRAPVWIRRPGARMAPCSAAIAAGRG